MIDINPTQHFSVDWLQAHIGSIYRQVNRFRFRRNRYGTLSRMWMHFEEHTIVIAYAIRHQDAGQLLDQLAHLYAWYCGLATQLDFQISDIVWHFFPYVCPTCWKKICICGLRKPASTLRGGKRQKDEARLAHFGRMHERLRPAELDDFVSMFGQIYGGHTDSVTLENIYLHFSEEVGEVATIIRRIEDLAERGIKPSSYLLRKLRSELADVFSWMCKLFYKINQEWDGLKSWFDRRLSVKNLPRLSYGVIVWIMYGNGCPYCSRRECIPVCPGLYCDLRTFHQANRAL